ncbi:hypothetical protein IAT40_003869 [Kwoniella sp. CBS 6097]
MYLDQIQKIIIGCAAVFASIVVLLLVFCLFSSRKASREELKARKAIGGRWKESNNTFDVEPLPCIETLNENDHAHANGSTRDSQYQYDEGGRPVPVRRGSGMAGVGTLAYKTSGRGKGAFGGAARGGGEGGGGAREANGGGSGSAHGQGHSGGEGSAAGLSRSASGGRTGQPQAQAQSGGLASEGRYPGVSQAGGDRFGRKPSEGKKGGWRRSIERSLKGHHNHGRGQKHGHRYSWGREPRTDEQKGKNRRKKSGRYGDDMDRGKDRRKRKGSGRS